MVKDMKADKTMLMVDATLENIKIACGKVGGTLIGMMEGNILVSTRITHVMEWA